MSASRAWPKMTHLFPQVIDEIMADMQHDHMVEVVKAGALRDRAIPIGLTDEGSARARDALERTQYIGPFPVDIDAYRKAIVLQTAESAESRPPPRSSRRCRSLILPEHFHRRIGPAINSGSSLFLYGPPGNGKTTVAQAIAKLLAGSRSDLAAVCRLHRRADHPDSRSAGTHPLRARRTVTRPTGKTGFIGVDKRWGLFQRPVGDGGRRVDDGRAGTAL